VVAFHGSGSPNLTYRPSAAVIAASGIEAP
jgi:hypothetical protein